MSEGKYKHIFFDLDHTLWDYERCSAETLTELYTTYKMANYGLFELADFIRSFEGINSKLWELYNNGQIERETLRRDRFVLVMADLGLDKDLIPVNLGEDYMSICPKKSHLMPFAKEVLEYLKDKNYALHIITNGFEEIQYQKMNSSGITEYFDQIITSEKAGKKKPYRQIFDYALKSARAERKQSMMVGDNLKADIGGAKLAEIDHVYFNPNKEPHQEKVQYEITCLSDLKGIL